MADRWGTPPWELEGKPLTPYRALLWKTRFVLYENEKIDKQQRDMEEMRNR